MADNLQPSNSNPSDEIDLGQLIDLVKNGFHSLGNIFLRIFIYLKNSALILAGLIVIGLLISFALSTIITKKLKTEVIVRPNFDSKNYLYDVVDEISSNIKTLNSAFFDEIEINVEELKGFKIEIKAITNEEDNLNNNNLTQIEYLEVLQNFKGQDFVIDFLRSELEGKSGINHKITFTYKDAQSGVKVVKKLMKYVGENEYFNELKTVHKDNAKMRLDKNSELIDQVDNLINNYSQGLLAEKKKSEASSIYMEKENTLNIPALLNLKNSLIRSIENTKLELVQNNNVLSILSFGKTQAVSTKFFNNTKLLIPLVLVIGFLLISFLKYLNRKAKEIE